MSNGSINTHGQKVVDALCLLSSMVEGGERHSDTSRQAYKDAIDATQELINGYVKQFDAPPPALKVPEDVRKLILGSHMVNVRIRHNGEWEEREADWLKEYLLHTPQVQQQGGMLRQCCDQDPSFEYKGNSGDAGGEDIYRISCGVCGCSVENHRSTAIRIWNSAHSFSCFSQSKMHNQS